LILLRNALLVTLALAQTATPSEAQLSVVQGPVDADVIRVLDGDTFTFKAAPFPQLAVWGTLRVDGIDTPEKRGKCQREKDKAAEATTFLLNLLQANGNRVRLYVVGLEGEDGGGFGRYRAQVKVGNEWLSERMIADGYARENHGEPRKPWCPAP
jgi:micrococcal nuclease